MRRLPCALLVLAIVGAGLAGCDADPTHDVGYYKANKVARDKKIAQCEGDPGRLSASPNCVNAKAALDQVILNPGNSKMGSIK